MFVILFPLFIMATVVLFFQNCAKNFQVTDLSSKSVVAAESDPSLLQGKFIEVHADPVEPTSEKVSFFILQKENGELFLLDKNNYPPGSFDAIKRNSSVTIRLSNESIGAVLLSKTQMTKTGSTFGALKPEQVASMGPPPLIKIKGNAIYQNLPASSFPGLQAEFVRPSNPTKMNTKAKGAGDADLNVAVVFFKFDGSFSSGDGVVTAASATDRAVRLLNKNSYNKIRLHFDEENDAYLLDSSKLEAARAYAGCEYWTSYSEQAIRYAATQGVTKNKSYHRVVAILPSESPFDTKDCDWAGITDGGEYNNLEEIPHVAVKGPRDHTIAHELGHTLNLGHSGAQNMNDP